MKIINKTHIKITIIFLISLIGIISFKVIFPKNEYLISKKKDVVSVSFEYRFEATKKVKVNELKLYLIKNNIEYHFNEDICNINFLYFQKEVKLIEKIKEINNIREIINLNLFGGILFEKNLSFNIQEIQNKQDEVSIYFENTNTIKVVEVLLKNGINYHQKNNQTFILNKRDLDKLIESLKDLGINYLSIESFFIIILFFLMFLSMIIIVIFFTFHLIKGGQNGKEKTS